MAGARTLFPRFRGATFRNEISAGLGSCVLRAGLPRQLACCGVLLAVFSGCNQSTTEPQAQNSQASDPTANQPHPLDGAETLPGSWNTADSRNQTHSRNVQVNPVSSSQPRDWDTEFATGSVRDRMAGPAASKEAASGTPEWDIRQIASILSEARRKQSPAGTGSAQIRLTPEENRRIVGLATHAIAHSHNRPDKELVFLAAVHSLTDARLSLALEGDRASLDTLYEDAAALAEKHPGSPAAATVASGVIRLARTMAEREGRDSPWVSEYVRLAKLFAVNFPTEEARAIVQLTTAAEFCEEQQLILPALECHTFIQRKFPESPFTDRADAAARRLNLIGKPLPLEGPSLKDGNVIHLRELAGKPVLIAFWSARSTAFLEDLPLIRQLCESTECQLLGINLDTDEQTVRQFVSARELPGKHIFYTEAALQGAAQPMARQFGIHTIPTYWLVDNEGKVLSTHVSRERLEKLTQSRQ